MLLSTFLPAVSALPAERTAQSPAPGLSFKDAARLMPPHPSRRVLNRDGVRALARRTKAKREGRQKEPQTARGKQTPLCEFYHIMLKVAVASPKQIGFRF